MVLSDSILQDFPDTGRITGSYILFFQGGPIYHCTHVPGPVAQSSAESYYNPACTAVMYLANFIMLNNELMKKDINLVPEQAPLIILDRKSSVFMYNDVKDTKHTRHISRRIQFWINGEEWNLYKTVWCEGGLKLSYIGTKNVREDELNPVSIYALVRIYNWWLSLYYIDTEKRYSTKW